MLPRTCWPPPGRTPHGVPPVFSFERLGGPVQCLSKVCDVNIKSTLSDGGKAFTFGRQRLAEALQLHAQVSLRLCIVGECARACECRLRVRPHTGYPHYLAQRRNRTATRMRGVCPGTGPFSALRPGAPLRARGRRGGDVRPLPRHRHGDRRVRPRVDVAYPRGGALHATSISHARCDLEWKGRTREGARECDVSGREDVERWWWYWTWIARRESPVLGRAVDAAE